MNQPIMSDQTPPSRGQRLAIFIEDALIVLSLVFLLCKMIFGWWGWASTILTYAALAAMVVVAVNRFRRIKRASEPPEDSGNTKPGF